MALWRIEQNRSGKFVLTDQSRYLDWLAVMAIAASPGFLLVLLIPPALVLPVLSIVSFLLGCGVALFAHYRYPARGEMNQVLWDLACGFTFVWIIAGVLGNPRHLIDVFDQLAVLP